MKKLPKLPISTLPTSHRARSSWPNALAPLKLKYMSVSSLVSQSPSRRSKADAPLKALLVDSWYDQYLGVMVLVRIIDGRLKKGQKIKMLGTGASYEIDRVGVMTPKLLNTDELGPGEIGVITGSIKEVADTRVGDTITDDRKPCAEALRRWASSTLGPAHAPLEVTCMSVGASRFESVDTAQPTLMSFAAKMREAPRPAKPASQAHAPRQPTDFVVDVADQ